MTYPRHRTKAPTPEGAGAFGGPHVTGAPSADMVSGGTYTEPCTHAQGRAGQGRGRDSPGFRVWSGLLMRSPDPELVLATPDAGVAVEALVKLLTTDG